MIKAVYFDYGGVLSPGGLQSVSRQVPAEYFGITPAEVQTQDLDNAFYQGKITIQQFFEEVSRRHGAGRQALTEDIYVSKADIFQRNEQVYALAERLRATNIITGIMANVTALNGQLLAKRGYYHGFMPVILSYMVQAAKPDPMIYQQGLEKIGVSAEKVLFVDDKKENVEGALRFGMQGLLSINPDQTVQAITSLVHEQNGITV